MLFLEDEQVTVESTLPAINHLSWVHFACHGSPHPDDPTSTAVEQLVSRVLWPRCGQ